HLTHKVLQATLESAKPPLGFEQRMVSSFRNRIPNQGPRLTGFFVNALRWRAIQAAGIAVVFIVLVQMGRILTGDANLDLSQTPLAFLARPPQTAFLGAEGNGLVAARVKETDRVTDRESFSDGLATAQSASGKEMTVATAPTEPVDTYRTEDK